MRLAELVKYDGEENALEMKGPIARRYWLGLAHVEVASVGHVMQLCMFTYGDLMHTPYTMTFEDLQARDWFQV